MVIENILSLLGNEKQTGVTLQRFVFYHQLQSSIDETSGFSTGMASTDCQSQQFTSPRIMVVIILSPFPDENSITLVIVTN